MKIINCEICDKPVIYLESGSKVMKNCKVFCDECSPDDNKLDNNLDDNIYDSLKYIFNIK